MCSSDLRRTDHGLAQRAQAGFGAVHSSRTGPILFGTTVAVICSSPEAPRGSDGDSTSHHHPANRSNGVTPFRSSVTPAASAGGFWSLVERQTAKRCTEQDLDRLQPVIREIGQARARRAARYIVPMNLSPEAQLLAPILVAVIVLWFTEEIGRAHV